MGACGWVQPGSPLRARQGDQEKETVPGVWGSLRGCCYSEGWEGQGGSRGVKRQVGLDCGEECEVSLAVAGVARQCAQV